MIDIHSIINALCEAAYITFMFSTPMIVGILISRPGVRWFLIAMFVVVLPVYVNMLIPVSQRLELLGWCAFFFSFILEIGRSLLND